jgi:hypothetical protein
MIDGESMDVSGMLPKDVDTSFFMSPLSPLKISRFGKISSCTRSERSSGKNKASGKTGSTAFEQTDVEDMGETIDGLLMDCVADLENLTLGGSRFSSLEISVDATSMFSGLEQQLLSKQCSMA